MGVDKKFTAAANIDNLPTNEETLPAEKDKPEQKTRRKKTEQQQILEELKNIRRLLAIPLRRYNVDNDKDAKFIERMNK